MPDRDAGDMEREAREWVHGYRGKSRFIHSLKSQERLSANQVIAVLKIRGKEGARAELVPPPPRSRRAARR